VARDGAFTSRRGSGEGSVWRGATQIRAPRSIAEGAYIPTKNGRDVPVPMICVGMRHPRGAKPLYSELWAAEGLAQT
jgi:hypothetical protein